MMYAFDGWDSYECVFEEPVYLFAYNLFVNLYVFGRVEQTIWLLACCVFPLFKPLFLRYA